MEVHSIDSKLSATASASNVAGEAAAGKQKENGNSNASVAVTQTANSNVDDSKAKIIGTQTPSTLTTSELFTLTPSRLLEDSTLEHLPEYCNQTFADIDVQNSRQTDLLIILIYCLALESSLALSEILSKVQVESFYWGSTYHKRNIAKLTKFPPIAKGNNENYVLKLSSFAHIDITDITLVGIPTGDSLIVTVTSGTVTPGCSVCLPVSRYVLSSIKSTNLAARFRNLKELSYVMKEKIFVPLKIRFAEYNGIDLYLGLCGLPEDIIYLILKKLNLKFAQNLSKTCRKMRIICENYRSILPPPPPMPPTLTRRDLESRMGTPASRRSFEYFYDVA